MSSPGDDTADPSPGNGAPTCLNCKAPTTGRYCAACGQDTRRGRLTFREILRDTAEHIFEWDSPVLRTIADLTWRPGYVAAVYVDGGRKRYANPLKYCFLAGALTIVVLQMYDLGPASMSLAPVGTRPAQTVMTDAIQGLLEITTAYSNVITIATLPILAVLLRLAFWRCERNIVEHFTMCLYVYGHAFAIQTAIIASRLVHTPVGAGASGLVPFVLLPLAAVQFCRPLGPRPAGRRDRILAVVLNLVQSNLAHLLYYISVSILSLAALAIWLNYVLPGGIRTLFEGP